MNTPKFQNQVVWCREKKICFSFDLKHWLWGYHRVPFDGLVYWCLGLGPFQIYNDYEPVGDTDDE